MKRLSLSRVVEISLLALLVLSILWKGGKSLEMTWLLPALSWIAVMTYWFRQRENSPRVPYPLWIALMLFILWSVLSFFLSTTQNYGLDELLRDGSFVLLFLWVVRRKSDDPQDHFEQEVKSILIYASILACIVGFGVYALQPVNRFVGTFFDHRFHTDYWPNAWAQFLLLTWPIVFLWAQRTLGTKHKLLRFFFLGILFGSFLLSYSRGALIALGGQVILFLLVSLWMEPRTMIERTKRLLAPLILSLIVAALTFTSLNLLRSRFFDIQSVSQKVTFTADEGTSSFTERSDFWKQSLNLIQKKPLFGWGPYSFRFIQPRLQTEVLATSDHPHNVFLKLAVERGIVASILFGFVMMFILLRFNYLLLVTSNSNQQVSNISDRLPIFISIAGVLAHNLIDYNLQFVGIALPFWLFLGFLSRSSIIDPVLTAQSSKLKAFKLFEILLASALLILAIWEGRFLVTSSVGRHLEARGKNEDALVWYDRSRNALFSRDLHLSRAMIHLNANRYSNARAALEDYRHQNQEDSRLWKIEGLVAEKLMNHRDTYRSTAQGFLLGPFNDLGVVRGFVSSLMALGRQEELHARRKEFYDLLKKYHDAIERNAHFIALSPAPGEFEQVTRLLSLVYPEHQAEFSKWTQEVRVAAKKERAKVTARTPGYLW